MNNLNVSFLCISKLAAGVFDEYVTQAWFCQRDVINGKVTTLRQGHYFRQSLITGINTNLDNSFR
jgi:hypothetical protein